MPRTYKRKTTRLPPDETKIVNALRQVEKGLSFRKAAREAGVHEKTLRNRVRKKTVAKSGGQMSLPEESERELALLLTLKAKSGFALTREEVRRLVTVYIITNKEADTDLGRHIRRKCRFKNDTPGSDWLKSFMERWNLSVKRPCTLDIARKIATSNHDKIYGYFDLIHKVLDQLKIRDRPECIWNVDETYLFTDCEAITVMAGISAGGEKLLPLIIFKGKNLMSNWHTSNVYEGTQVTTSENGCMMSPIFFSWFENFCANITQRPLLLIYDGDATHVNLKLIKHAQDNDVTLLKLPPHTTDRLQPLDVCCFRPLKTQWDKAITKWTVEHQTRRISKPEFIELTGQFWDTVFTPENINSTFRKLGIYPSDRDTYPTDAFKPWLLQLYYDSKPLSETPEAKPATPQREPARVDTTWFLSAGPSSASSPPPSTSACAASLPKENQSFEQLGCDRYARPSASETTNEGRVKIDPEAQVLTFPGFEKQIKKEKQMEQPKNRRTKDKELLQVYIKEEKNDALEEMDIGSPLASCTSDEYIVTTDKEAAEQTTMLHFNKQQYKKKKTTCVPEHFILYTMERTLVILGK